MFKKKEEKKELTPKQLRDVERIKALREIAHQETSAHNYGEISDEEYFKRMKQITDEVEWMAHSNAFDELLGHPMEELEKIFP